MSDRPHGIVGSICASNHPLGVLGDALALALANLVLGLAASPTAQSISWPPNKAGMRVRSLLCANDALCVLTPEFNSHLQGLAEMLSSSRNSSAVGAKAGLCGATSKLGCRPTKSGYWPASETGIRSLDDCVAKCQRCAACRYVSFSRAHDDCSWYSVQACNMAKLVEPPSTGLDYATKAVARDGVQPRRSQ